MTEQELEAIRQRAEQATPGPWSMKQEGADFYMADSQGRYLDITLADAIFAAHSRQDIPALLAEVERLKAALLYYATSIDDGGAIARNALKGGAKLQELIKDAKSMCVICGGPDWTHGARNHEYKGGSS